jgi:hypothetical protein
VDKLCGYGYRQAPARPAACWLFFVQWRWRGQTVLADLSLDTAGYPPCRSVLWACSVRRIRAQEQGEQLGVDVLVFLHKAHDLDRLRQGAARHTEVVKLSTVVQLLRRFDLKPPWVVVREDLAGAAHNQVLGFVGRQRLPPASRRSDRPDGPRRGCDESAWRDS